LGADYPQTGFDGSAFYVACNMFTLPFDGFESFLKAKIFIFDKNQLAAGSLSSNSIDVPGGAFALQPTTVIGGSTPGYVAYFSEMYGGSTTQVRLWHSRIR